MKLTKTLCGVTAALTVLSSIAMPVQAAPADAGEQLLGTVKSNGKALEIKSIPEIRIEDYYIIDDLNATYTFEIPEETETSEGTETRVVNYFGKPMYCFDFWITTKPGVKDYFCNVSWDTEACFSYGVQRIYTEDYSHLGYEFGETSFEVDILGGNISRNVYVEVFPSGSKFEYLYGYWLGSLDNGETYAGDGSGSFKFTLGDTNYCHAYYCTLYFSEPGMVTLSFSDKDKPNNPSSTASDTTSSTTSNTTSMTTSDTTSTTTSSTTSSTASNTTSSTTSNTTSTTTSNTTSSPNNPATGITMAMIPVALIGGAAVVAAKKRKK